MKHFAKQNSSLCSLHCKIGIHINNTVYSSKQKNHQFSSKKPSATKHSPLSNIYNMEFYRNFLFEYSLTGIVKPKFTCTRRNEIWCRILEIEDLPKNMCKTQDRTSLIPDIYYTAFKWAIDRYIKQFYHFSSYPHLLTRRNHALIKLS